MKLLYRFMVKRLNNHWEISLRAFLFSVDIKLFEDLVDFIEQNGVFLGHFKVLSFSFYFHKDSRIDKFMFFE